MSIMIHLTGWTIAMSALRYMLSSLSGPDIAAAIPVNIMFVVGIAWYVYSKENDVPFLAKFAVSTGAVLLLCVVAALMGVLLYDKSPLLGSVLMEAMSLGYYPPGPDAPIELAAGVWFLSMVALVIAGITLGVFAQKRIRDR